MKNLSRHSFYIIVACVFSLLGCSKDKYFDVAPFTYDPNLYKISPDLVGTWREFGNMEVEYKGKKYALYFHEGNQRGGRDSLFYKQFDRGLFSFNSDTTTYAGYNGYFNLDSILKYPHKFYATADFVFRSDGLVERYERDTIGHKVTDYDSSKNKNGQSLLYWAVNDPNVFSVINRFVANGQGYPDIKPIRFQLSANRDTIFPLVLVKGQWRRTAGPMSTSFIHEPFQGGFLVRVKK